MITATSLKTRNVSIYTLYKIEWRGNQNDLSLFDYGILYRRRGYLMHNLISFNQLAGWQKYEDVESIETNDKVNEYFDCLIDCDEQHGICKRICGELLK